MGPLPPTPWEGNQEGEVAWYVVQSFDLRTILGQVLPEDCIRMEAAGHGGLRRNSWLYRWPDGTPLDAVVRGAAYEMAQYGVGYADKLYLAGYLQLLRSMRDQPRAELEARLALAALGA